MGDPKYELRCLRRYIDAMEKKGVDCSLEKSFYFSWIKDPEYSEANKYNLGHGIYAVFSGVKNQRESVSKIKSDIKYNPAIYETNSNTTFEAKKRGRPRKDENISRVTKWRRGKEKQIALSL